MKPKLSGGKTAFRCIPALKVPQLLTKVFLLSFLAYCMFQGRKEMQFFYIQVYETGTFLVKNGISKGC